MWLIVPDPMNPSTLLRSAPEAAGSTSPQDWQLEMLERSLWWRGKPSPLRSWATRCKKVSYLQRLCGRMLPPSEAESGVTEFIASLQDIPVRHFPLQESVLELQIPDISGQTSDGVLSKSDRHTSSSKTSEVTSALDGTLLPESSSALDMKSNMESSALPESASPIGASASSPGAITDGSQRNWPTPNAGQRGGFNQSPSEGAAKRPTLQTASEMWATPTNITGGANSNRENRPQTGGHDLQEQTNSWATPQAHDMHQGDPKRVGRFGTKHGGRNPNDEAANWDTPRACTGERSSGMNRTELVEAYLSPRPDLQTSKDGDGSSNERRTLNPLFVEWLQGWPIEWTASECSATAFTLWQQRMRSELSMLVSKQGSKSSPQLGLFE